MDTLCNCMRKKETKEKKEILELIQQELGVLYENIDESGIEDLEYFDPTKTGKRSLKTRPYDMKLQDDKRAAEQKRQDDATLELQKQNEFGVEPASTSYNHNYNQYQYKAPKYEIKEEDKKAAEFNWTQKVMTSKFLQDELKKNFNLDSVEDIKNLSEEDQYKLIAKYKEWAENTDENKFKEDRKKNYKGFQENFLGDYDPSQYYKVSTREDDQPNMWGQLFNYVTDSKTFQSRPPIISTYNKRTGKPYSKEEIENFENFRNRKDYVGGPAVPGWLMPTGMIGTAGKFGAGTKFFRDLLRKGMSTPVTKLTGLDKISNLTGLSSKIPGAVKNCK